ncbi:g11460 [Coccomyxa viridis]|uniref:G11460 protein n=1 Tax=Coccomyxa viridis TaxID=1274662 RepID=A0ABP1GAM9_9CHLO
MSSFLDSQPAWTLDQIAGLAFGGILVASVFFASKVDDIIAKSQRRDLGLCEECGGLYSPDLCQEGNCPSKGKSSAQL